MTTRPHSDPPATLTASGIAKMAGVGRAAVSNWRRRYADFPLPVGGTAASPVFDVAAVEQWLRRQGRGHEVSAQEWLWRHVESYTPTSRIGDALCLAGVCLLAASWETTPPGPGPRPPSPARLLARLRARDEDLADLAARVMPAEWSPQHETIIAAAGRLRWEQDPGEAFEYLHAQYASSTRHLSGPDATPAAVAEIMLSLAGTGPAVFDFTSGTGSILRAAAERALGRGEPIRCHGQEAKPQHALTTLLRVWFVHDRAVAAGQAAEPPVVHVGDSLLADRFPGFAADLVVANPPFGIHDWGHERLAYDPRWTFGLPPRTEPELAWVQHALSHLTPGRTAVLLMPPAAAARPAGRRIRGELVRHGALRAVIALPAGLLPPAAVGLHLWVLTRPLPDAPAPRLLFVDSTAGNRSPARSADLSGVRDVITRAWQAYRAGPGGADEPGVHRVVPAVDVLDDEVDLTPRRYLPTATGRARNPEQTLASVRRFGRLIDEIRTGLPEVRVADTAPVGTAPTADVADLLRSGSLSLHRSVTRPRDAETAAGPTVEVTVLAGSDVLTGGPPTGTATQAADRRPTCVEAGDVLIPVIAREIVARVATADQVGAELGPGVHVLRVNPEVLDPWFLAGVLSRTDNARVAGRVSTTTGGMLRIDVKRLTVPVLPIGTQREHGDAFRRLAEFQIALARAAEQGGELAREITDGLAAGALTADG